jgi:hypothetical protein
MSCCGKARSQVLPVGTRKAAARPTAALFEYVGRTRLAMIGPVTRTSYIFDRPGARVLVDGRDRASLSMIPVLRQVGG